MQFTADLHGRTRFVSMQHQYNLVQREEEREMFGLLADQGVASIPWNPLAAGLVTRPWGTGSTARAAANQAVDQYGRPLYLESDRATVDAVEQIAKGRGVSMAQIAMAWALSNPVVTAPLIGATKPGHLADAVAARRIELEDGELAALNEPYLPREPTYF